MATRIWSIQSVAWVRASKCQCRKNSDNFSPAGHRALSSCRPGFNCCTESRMVLFLCGTSGLETYLAIVLPVPDVLGQPLVGQHALMPKHILPVRQRIQLGPLFLSGYSSGSAPISQNNLLPFCNLLEPRSFLPTLRVASRGGRCYLSSSNASFNASSASSH